ncbi:hypothetical protein Pla175_13850 [Pirellulimonas nuda]|uniref:Phage holin family protein n=1 Tax=Pirellulimonas nuda TaxID=2528009 RepID=A0A518D962_9BACT|nr:phage holin family protein [Pirellulimonas nuda]QDU88016.1 hypothetical protein Pla175_13850 [Pirellulimonas nuda]
MQRFATQADPAAGNGRPRGRPSGPNRAHLLRSLTQLAKLQGELIQADFGEARQRAGRSLVVFAVCGVIGVAAVHMLMLGLAELLTEATSLSRMASLFIVAAVGLTAALAAGAAAWSRVRGASQLLRRTKRELKRNLRAAEDSISQLFEGDQ